MISQVKMCHLVNDLLQNVVARLVENASHDGLCFDVSILGRNPSRMTQCLNQTLHYGCFPNIMALDVSNIPNIMALDIPL